IICRKNDVKWLLKKEERFLTKIAEHLIGDTKNDKFIVHWNIDMIVFEHKFIGINFKSAIKKINATLVLNSTLFILTTELYGKSNLGEGALYLVPLDVKQMIIINPNLFNFDSFLEKYENFLKRPIYSIFTELGFDPNKPIREQEPNPLPDRKALDDIIFDALELTEEERKEVY
ncbi:MAG: hypothetical protein ACP5QN_03415, partial [Minisyncoccia bacterium]